MLKNFMSLFLGVLDLSNLGKMHQLKRFVYMLTVLLELYQMKIIIPYHLMFYIYKVFKMTVFKGTILMKSVPSTEVSIQIILKMARNKFLKKKRQKKIDKKNSFQRIIM